MNCFTEKLNTYYSHISFSVYQGFRDSFKMAINHHIFLTTHVKFIALLLQPPHKFQSYSITTLQLILHYTCRGLKYKIIKSATLRKINP